MSTDTISAGRHDTLRHRHTGPAALERMRSAARRVPRPLALLILVGALQALAWNLALPDFQGPDESGHFAYIQHFAETGSFPSATAGTSPNSGEVSTELLWLNLEPTLGDLGGKPAWTSADLKLWRAQDGALPASSRADGLGPNPIAKNPPLYYVVMAAPYRVFIWLALPARVFVLRLFNALFYLATIVLTWLLAGEVFGRVRWKQVLAAGVVALEPQLAFMSAVINADTLLATLMTAVLYSSVRLVNRGPTVRRVLATSGLTAATLLTHGRGLAAVPVLVTALAVSLIRHRTPLLDGLRRVAGAAATVGAALIAYVLFGKGGSGGLYGGQVSELNSGAGFNVRQFLSSVYQFYFPRLPSMQPRLGPEYGYKQVFIETFFGTFGSLEVAFKQRVYDVLQVLSAVGLVGLYTAIVARRRALLRAWPVVLVMLSLLVTTLFFLHYVSYQALLGDNATDPLIVGRYLLPMVSLFGLAIVFTVGTLPRRIAPLVGGAILALGLLLSLAGIGITAARFYA